MGNFLKEPYFKIVVGAGCWFRACHIMYVYVSVAQLGSRTRTPAYPSCDAAAGRSPASQPGSSQEEDRLGGGLVCGCVHGGRLYPRPDDASGR